MWSFNNFEKVHIIIHAAGIASPFYYKKYPIETLDVAVNGTRNVLDLAKIYEAKVNFFSSSEIYGDPKIEPQSESYWGNVNPIGPRACYDEGKRAAETLFFDYYRQHNLDIRVVRIFNTFGPNMSMNDGRVVSNFITQAINNKPITIYTLNFSLLNQFKKKVIYNDSYSYLNINTYID